MSGDQTPCERLDARIETRKRELQGVIDRLAPGDRVREDMEAALRALAEMLPDDPSSGSTVVEVALSRWLERTERFATEVDP